MSQRRQERLALVETFWSRWRSLQKEWGLIVFVGREPEDYYQAVDRSTVRELKEQANKPPLQSSTIWAREAVYAVCGLLSEVCVRIMQGHLTIRDVYPVFGSQLLRQSYPLRVIFDNKYPVQVHKIEVDTAQIAHERVREEMQDWLIYHDGIRRRCLILVDLLWAEASQLEDLPAHEMRGAADAKRLTGKFCRQRIFQECVRLNGINRIFHAWSLARYLRHA